MSLSLQIKQWATELGFGQCGLAKATPMHDEIGIYNTWLNKGYEAGMSYLHNYKDIKENPELLLEGAKTVIMTLQNYYPNQTQSTEAPQIAKYAYGRDYHKVLLKKQKLLLAKIQEYTSCNGRIFIDSAPVLERSWAVRAGLGWIGKNTNLISPTLGVHTLISGMMIDIDVDQYDTPYEGTCGKCSNCLKACPTKALSEPYTIDSRKCISYLTIEHKGDFNDQTNLHQCVFGCDKCIDACPFTKKVAHQEPQLKAKDAILDLNLTDWKNMNEGLYETLFNGTPVRRAKYTGIKRNIKHL